MRRRFVRYCSGLMLLAVTASAHAVSCVTQSEMTAAERKAIESAALAIADNIQQRNLAALKEQTASAVSAQFSGIADSIQSVQPEIRHATLTADALYELSASDLSRSEEAQFFCSVPASSLIVTLTIPNLPPGNYALAILHATGVEHPQQLSLILSRTSSSSNDWKLAGFFVRPMTMGGHDGVWFWKKAREYTAQKQLWNAWFYYQAAQYLLVPVDFLSSPNLQRLEREAQTIEPAGLPCGSPMTLTDQAQKFEITNLHPGGFAGELDLVVRYRGSAGSDPTAERAQVVAVMRALLREHPELASAFHGLWVYAVGPDNLSPFALELPMEQIQNTTSQSVQPSESTVNPRKQAV